MVIQISRICRSSYDDTVWLLWGWCRTYWEKDLANLQKWRIFHFILFIYLLFVHLWEITEKILYIIKTSDKNVNHCHLPIKDYISQTTIMVIIFWDFLTLDQVFLSPQENEGRLSVINMVCASCLTSCRTISRKN